MWNILNCCLPYIMPLSGKMDRAISFVTRVRKALFDGEEIIERSYKEDDLCDIFAYDDKTTDVFRWFKRSISLGLKDIKLIIPREDNDYGLKAFANMKDLYILVYLKDKCEVMSLNEQRKEDKWQYTFAFIDEIKPIYIYLENKTEKFETILFELWDYAFYSIDNKYWASIFLEALHILEDKIDITVEKYRRLNEKYFYLPEEFIRILIASDTADVFGGMGSWNDSPAYAAGESEEKYNEYQNLSLELSRLVDYHYMYSANECFKK